MAILPKTGKPERATELLEQVASAYRHYDHPAGAQFKVGKICPVEPAPPSLHPRPAGLFGRRSILGVREVAALWHPPGAADETFEVERSGSKALPPPARALQDEALVGATTTDHPREVRFPDDLLRRHHLYVARTRMGKSTLMRHLVAHKLREKAAGRDGDAIVVVDPHADLVASLLAQVPESLAADVRLIDLADERGAPGINLLDTRIFSDRDRTADSVVRVARGLWEQWGPRMQSILEPTVKTLHEANSHPHVDAEDQYTILDGLRLLTDEQFRNPVLAKLRDPYLLEWWSRDFGGWRKEYQAEALAPVQTRLTYYASSLRARAILGQSRSTIDLRRTLLEGGILFVSTARASFVLATQSLRKLDDLSPTMRDTLLANVGCLAVFQVSGRDARELVWELGRERLSEDDIVGQTVHHCYVRASVGTERLPAFSMTVRKPGFGDPQRVARIRAAASAYVTPTETIEAQDVERQRRLTAYQQGLEALREEDSSAPPLSGQPGIAKRSKHRSKRARGAG